VERDWDILGDKLAAESFARGDATGWFDRLYAAGVTGEVSMPWDRSEPHPLLQEWAERRGLAGAGRTAVVVGCGLGADAEYLAGLGFRTTGFDVAETAVRLARERNPGTEVDYRVADLRDLPADWVGAFDLVVEIFTMQALPPGPRADAVRGIASLVAPGGTLLAVAFRPAPGTDLEQGPPFALPRAAMDDLAVDGISVLQAEELDGPRWRVEYRRG
jgi:SAM-dependent methyltransferase